jgi:hypothetical protein
MTNQSSWAAFALSQVTGQQPAVKNVTKSKVSADDSR